LTNNEETKGKLALRYIKKEDLIVTNQNQLFTNKNLKDFWMGVKILKLPVGSEFLRGI